MKKSLRLVYVYAIAAGAIFTFIGYWDTIFYEYCGAGTFLGFALMTLLILPIAMVYCELAPLFPKAGGELIYNTVGINKHVGFFSSWLIMAAWIAVPPSSGSGRWVQWLFPCAARPHQLFADRGGGPGLSGGLLHPEPAERGGAPARSSCTC
ncbi:MAG: hypothetical protein V8T62_01300 [Oscillospiraceae bacterium]